MASLSDVFKREIAMHYSERKQSLDKLDPNVLEQFASKVLEVIEKEKEKTSFTHDIEVLEQSMKHLMQDSAKLKSLQLGTDDYDFTQNDCKNLVSATKRWLKAEGLI